MNTAREYSLADPDQEEWASVFSDGLLGFAYLEHLGAAGWARSLSRGATVVHGDCLGTLHLFLRPALNAIRFSHYSFLVSLNDMQRLCLCE
jgi:hypothetical protein